MLLQLQSLLTISYNFTVIPGPTLGVPCLDKWMPLLDIGKPVLSLHWFLLFHCSPICCWGCFGAYDFLGVKWTLQGPECRALVLSLEKVVIIRGKTSSIF